MTAPRSDIQFFDIDQGGVLFHESRQRFYSLNAAAAICWLGLSEGIDESAIVAELTAAGAPQDAAEAWLSRSLDLFRAEGFLEADDSFEIDRPPARAAGLALGKRLERVPAMFVRRRYRLFDQAFAVGFANEAAAARCAGMFAALAQPDEGPGEIEISVVESEGNILVARDGAILGAGTDLAGLAARLEAALLLTAIDATPHLLALHAGVTAREDCGLVLPGPSGSGKTTLVAALAAQGWAYGTDEFALLAADGRALLTAPVSACIKEGSWPLLAEFYPDLPVEPIQQRRRRRVRYLPPPGQVIEHCRASHVVFPRRVAPEEAQGLRALGRGEGLARLLAECVSVPQRLGVAEATLLVDWARGLSFHELAFGGLQGAMAALETLAG